MQHLPWSFVATVLVPLYLIMHAVIGAQLRVTSQRTCRNAHLSCVVTVFPEAGMLLTL
jgi:hypothetical protein